MRTKGSASLDPTGSSSDVDGADRVIVSFRSPETDPDAGDDWWIADSTWLQESMTERSYRRYLRRAHAGPVSVGDEWEEFVNCGCASPEDVILRVERVDGGTVIDEETTIEVVSRRAVVEEAGDHPADDA